MGIERAYGVQVPVVQVDVEPLEVAVSQAALSVTGEPPVQVMVVVLPVASLVPVAIVAPDAFLIVRISVPVALAPA
jgi:hypothetical protein